MENLFVLLHRTSIFHCAALSPSFSQSTLSRTRVVFRARGRRPIDSSLNLEAKVKVQCVGGSLLPSVSRSRSVRFQYICIDVDREYIGERLSNLLSYPFTNALACSDPIIIFFAMLIIRLSYCLPTRVSVTRIRVPPSFISDISPPPDSPADTRDIITRPS